MDSILEIHYRAELANAHYQKGRLLVKLERFEEAVK